MAIPVRSGGQDAVLWFTFPVTMTLDHVVARARGGCNHRHNLTVLCDQCNNEKGIRLPWEDHDPQANPLHNRRATLPASWSLEVT